MIEKFNLFCQKILPLVYDDSLSYYEAICKTVNKINELIKAINNISIDILEQANKYTDDKIRDALSDVERAVQEINELKEELTENYNNFVNLTNANITLLESDFNSFKRTIDNEIVAIANRTEFLIKENNVYLFEELGKTLGNIRVINYFTGEPISVQEMFDTLAQLHINNPMTYDMYRNKNISYAGLSLLNITYTQLVINGNNLIP